LVCNRWRDCPDIRDQTPSYLLVNPTGSKLWRVKYWINGIERKLSLGAYPEIPLAHLLVSAIWGVGLLSYPPHQKSPMRVELEVPPVDLAYFDQMLPPMAA